MAVYVLAKSAKVEGDAAPVTIHGYTDSDVFVNSWENAAEDNISFTVDLESAASFEPLSPNEQD
jgi:hypothetical protein